MRWRGYELILGSGGSSGGAAATLSGADRRHPGRNLENVAGRHTAARKTLARVGHGDRVLSVGNISCSVCHKA